MLNIVLGLGVLTLVATYMRTFLRVSAIVLSLLGNACARAEPLAVAPAPGAVAPATAADIAAAMQDTVAGWFAYASDGTARSDTARRLAALAMWDAEGGDRERGTRLLEAAQRLGVADSMFYVHGGLAAEYVGRPDLAESLYREAIDRWPGFPPALCAYAGLLEAKGRRREADSLRVRAAALEAQNGPPAPAETSEVVVTGPTVIAFWLVPASDSVLDADPGLASALDDHQYYWAETRPQLEAEGIAALDQPGRRFLVCELLRQWVFVAHPDSAATGFLLIEPGRAPRILYGRHFPNEVLAAARAEFRSSVTNP